MEGLILLLQIALLIAAGAMVWRVREELQLLVKQATTTAPEQQLQHLQQEFQQTLHEMRQAVQEGVAQLDERIARAEQVLEQLKQHLPAEPVPLANEPKLPVEQIVALAQKGLGIEEIARQTGVAAGEVALVLQLRTRRSRPTRTSRKQSEKGEEKDTLCDEA